MATLNGTSAADILNGTGLSDTIYGYGGNDLINGYAGNDFLYGGGGKDTLNGGPGNDTLRGNAGADTFLYQPGDGQDVIGDFGLTDAVMISGYTFALSIIRSGTSVVVTFSPFDKITFNGASVATVQAGLHFQGHAGVSGAGSGTITGIAAHDVLTGTSGSDVIEWLGGDHMFHVAQNFIF